MQTLWTWSTPTATLSSLAASAPGSPSGTWTFTPTEARPSEAARTCSSEASTTLYIVSIEIQHICHIDCHPTVNSAYSTKNESYRYLCNHRRAYKLFTDSISPKCKFTAFPCESYEKVYNPQMNRENFQTSDLAVWEWSVFFLWREEWGVWSAGIQAGILMGSLNYPNNTAEFTL